MGKLIVLEGTDGSGKATQCGLLLDALREKQVDCRRVEFPRYSQESSALIRLYLDGKFGDRPSDVGPYAASTFYAVDRYASFKQDWGGFYRSGGVILADRYTTSNAVHQGSKLRGQDRQDFFRWLFDFEYRLMGLPAPDLVLYLDVPTEITLRNMRRRGEETGAAGDIHEKDAAYLRACRSSALEAAGSFGWQVVDCTEDGEMRPPEEIHRQLLRLALEVL